MSAIPIRMPGTEQTFNGHYPCLNYLSLPPNPIRNTIQPLPINSTKSIFRIVTHVKERQEEFLQQNPDSKLLTSKAETIKCNLLLFFPLLYRMPTLSTGPSVKSMYCEHTLRTPHTITKDRA